MQIPVNSLFAQRQNGKERKLDSYWTRVDSSGHNCCSFSYALLRFAEPELIKAKGREERLCWERSHAAVAMAAAL